MLSRALDHVGVFARIGRGRRAAGRGAGRVRRRGSRHAAARAPAACRRRRRASRRCRRGSPSCARPAWKLIEPVTSEAFAELVEALGEAVTEVELGSSFDSAIDLHRTVMEVDMAHNLHRDYEKGGDQLSDALRAAIERGRERAGGRVSARGRGERDAQRRARRGVQRIRRDPDHAGRAGRGAARPRPHRQSGVLHDLDLSRHAGHYAAADGDRERGMPLGVQLVGRRGNDARLLRTARWLVKTLGRKARPRVGPAARKGQ